MRGAGIEANVLHVARLHNLYPQAIISMASHALFDILGDLAVLNCIQMLLSEIKKRSVVSSQAHPRDSESNPSRQMPGVRL